MKQANSNIKKHKICITVIILFTLFIWWNSSKSADVSVQESSFVLSIVMPFFQKLGIDADIAHTVIRKLAHFTEYGILGSLWAGELIISDRNNKILGIIHCIGLCMLTALLDETIQLFVAGRSGEIRDIWIDTSGAVCGVIGIFLIYKIYLCLKN